MKSTRKPTKTALTKVMDYLAKRDHSIRELVQKMKTRFATEEIRDAIEYAIRHGWIPEPDALAKKVAAQLKQKNRGILYVNKYLHKKGLPKVIVEKESELESARVLAERKIRSGPPYTFEQKKVIYRFLANKGFTDDVCKTVMNEKA